MRRNSRLNQGMISYVPRNSSRWGEGIAKKYLSGTGIVHPGIHPIHMYTVLVIHIQIFYGDRNVPNDSLNEVLSTNRPYINHIANVYSYSVIHQNKVRVIATIIRYACSSLKWCYNIVTNFFSQTYKMQNVLS